MLLACLAVIVSGCAPASLCKSNHGNAEARRDAGGKASPQMSTQATHCDPRFTGLVSIGTVDGHGDGFAEALAMDAELVTTAKCGCLIEGYLSKAGRVITRCARYHDMVRTSRFRFEGPEGTHIAHVEFSGQEIFESGEDGPYAIMFAALSSSSSDSSGLAVLVDSLTVTTPAYSRDVFGEWTAGIASVLDRGVDFDGDRFFDVLRVSVEVTVRQEQRLTVLGNLVFPGESGEWHDLRARRDSVLTQGTHMMNLDFSGALIGGVGRDGPFEVVVRLGEPVPLWTNVKHDTEPYRFTQFE